MTEDSKNRHDVLLPASLYPTHPDHTRERYSVRQAAEYLQIAVSRVYSEAAASRLGCLRDGARRIRFAQADLDAWRLARRVEARPDTRRTLLVGGPLKGRGLEPLPIPKVKHFS